MPTGIERFLKGTNNLIQLTLTEDGAPVDITVATRVDIRLGNYLTISRTGSTNGVDFSQGNGLLVINPGKLTEDLSQVPDQMMPTLIRIFDIQNTEGAVFGGADSDPRLMFSVRTPIG